MSCALGSNAMPGEKPAEYFEPIVIRYDGLDADQHQVELGSLGESYRGAAKLIGIAGNLAVTGKYVKKTPALAVRVYARPATRGSFELAAYVATLTPFLPELAKGGTKLLEIIVNFILAKLSGKKGEVERLSALLEKAMTEMGAATRHAQAMIVEASRAADGQRAAARQFIAPIGGSVAIARIGHSEAVVPMDASAKEAIESESTAEISEAREYSVRLTELDLQARACKATIQGDDDATQRYPCEIVDPVVTTTTNKYSEALHTGAWLTVMAKAHIRDGDIERLTIIDAK